MNLYKFHTDAESLDHYEKAQEKVPKLVWDKYFVKSFNRQALEERKDVIVNDPKYAFIYADFVLNGPFPEGEKGIAKSAKWSFEYALRILRGRFIEGEKEILKNPDILFKYVFHVISGPFPEAEDTIAKDPKAAYEYALNNLNKKRFIKGEATILKSPFHSALYAVHILRRPWPNAEKGIFANTRSKSIYLIEFPERAPK